MIDTNSLAILVSALTQQKAAVPSSNLVLILVTITPLIAALTAWFAKKTAVSVEKIHVAVNSERTAALDEIKNLRLEVKALSERIAFDAGKDQEGAAAVIEEAIIAASKKVQENSNQPNGPS